MIKDEIVSLIIQELIEKENCFSVILYGSRARGDHTITSDYDIAGITTSQNKKRIARFDTKTQTYHDIFIIPQAQISSLQEEYITMAEGVCVFDPSGIGEKFIQDLKELVKKVPILPADEIVARKVWYKKMLARSQKSDIEAQYRKIWMIYAILEDYFVFKNMRYMGPKKAFQYLEKKDKETFVLFNNVLFNLDNLDFISELIQKVCKPF